MFRTTKTRAVAVAAAVVAAVSMSTVVPAAQAASNNTLTIAMQGTIDTYDPWTAGSGFNGSLLSNIALYDSLLHLDANGKPTPWLATKWTSVDSSHYTLTLRSGVKFADGSALDAAAVVANIAYSAKATTPGECNKYISGVSATASGSSVVKFELDKPNVNFLTDLGACASFIVNPTALADPTTLKNTPAGSGPYVLDAANSVLGQKWVFKRNPNYWNKAAYGFDNLVLVFYQDSTAAANAAKSGEVDMIQSVDPARDTSGLAKVLTSTDFRGLFINDVRGKLAKPLADVRVRQAMQYAIDRVAITKALYGKTGTVGYSTPFAVGSDGYSKALATRFPYDPAKAKSLLKAAGYANGFTVDVFLIPFMYGDAAQLIANYLAKVGITLKLSDESANFFGSLKSGKWPILMFNMTIGANPVNAYRDLTSTDGFWNTLKSYSPQMNALLAQLDVAKDAKARTAVLSKIAREFQEESWYLVPTLIRGATAYDSKKVKVTATLGAPLPMLYNIKKIG